MVADETTKDVHIAIKDGDAEAGESLEVRLPWYKRYMSWIIGVCLLLVVIAVALGVGLGLGLKSSSSPESYYDLGGSGVGCDMVMIVSNGSSYARSMYCSWINGRAEDMVYSDKVYSPVTFGFLHSHGSGYNADYQAQFLHEAFAQSGMTAQSALLQAEWWPVDPSPFLKRPYFNLSIAPFLYYSDDDIRSWKAGGMSRNAGLQLSSFAVFDLLLNVYLNCTKFPSLKTIIILGHSGGGYFTQRYVLASPLPHWIDKTYVSLQTMHAGDTYFTYYNQSRILASTPKSGNVTNYTLYTPNETTCSGFNAWPFGLDGYTSGGNYNYLQTVTSKYGFWMWPNTTYVTYSVGIQDTSFRAFTCPMSVQGLNRVIKQQYWAQFLQAWSPNTSNWSQFLYQDFGHDDVQIATSVAMQIYFSNPYLIQPTKLCTSSGVAALANTSYLSPLTIVPCYLASCLNGSGIGGSVPTMDYSQINFTQLISTGGTISYDDDA